MPGRGKGRGRVQRELGRRGEGEGAEKEERVKKEVDSSGGAFKKVSTSTTYHIEPYTVHVKLLVIYLDIICKFHCLKSSCSSPKKHPGGD